MKPQNLHAHEDRLLDFAYGELPAPEAQVVESHLQGCARCTQALDDIRGVRVTMSQLSEESAPDAGLESLLAYAQQSARRAAAGPAPTPSRWRRWLLPVVGLASVGTLGILTLNAQSPELTRPNLSAVEMQSSKAVPAPKPVPAPSVAPAQAVAEAPPPPADTIGGASDSRAKEARKSRAEESKRAEGWEMAGSGGGFGTRSRSDELKSKVKPSAIMDGKQSAAKTEPAEKAPREVSNLNEEALAEGSPALSQPAAPESPPQEPLRLGGALAKKESVKDKDDAPSSKGGTWDEGPGAPALEAVTEPMAQGVVASAPAPSGSYAGRGGVAPPTGGASDDFAQASTPRAKSTMKPAKAPSREQLSRPEPAAVRRAESEAEDRSPGLSVAELSLQAQAANRTGDRDQEVRLLRLALDSGASSAERLGLLTRLCDAELALGRRREGLAACNQVLTEAPGSSAAQAARRRLSRESVSVETPAVDSQPAP
ncbi:zf-HC2 domain-containing protein [Myxococcus qinghaiensis]|uniref:zf-HC2 domain-containing protein n=1 Tax=Myxococcus qinghaiensis TaxID=2906758 RepID=UPI0020A76F41|nr:zf-HC2 domain-containing protein [Myxococcus qinghaiensis]MCP3168601.1 zf-HC2 domain-containing protein [Myxococcus qinghaiensis]